MCMNVLLCMYVCMLCVGFGSVMYECYVMCVNMLCMFVCTVVLCVYVCYMSVRYVCVYVVFVGMGQCYVCCVMCTRVRYVCMYVCFDSLRYVMRCIVYVRV